MSRAAYAVPAVTCVMAGRERGGMLAAGRAEGVKLRTVSSSGWVLLAWSVVTMTVSSAVVAVEECSPASGAVDTTKVSLTGVQVGQAAVAGLAVLAIGAGCAP